MSQKTDPLLTLHALSAKGDTVHSTVMYLFPDLPGRSWKNLHESIIRIIGSLVGSPLRGAHVKRAEFI
jgi:hypothetical protein